MKNQSERNKRFRQYLAGLAIATAPATPALASAPPIPSLHPKVEFSSNLKEKLVAASPMVAPDEPVGPYKQTFGQVWPQIGPWWEIIYPKLARNDAAGSTLPSEVFKLVSGA
jgi:hypothetical protein